MYMQLLESLTKSPMLNLKNFARNFKKEDKPKKPKVAFKKLTIKFNNLGICVVKFLLNAGLKWHFFQYIETLFYNLYVNQIFWWFISITLGNKIFVHTNCI